MLTLSQTSTLLSIAAKIAHIDACLLSDNIPSDATSPRHDSHFIPYQPHFPYALLVLLTGISISVINVDDSC
jgi:hypothetical protein